METMFVHGRAEQSSEKIKLKQDMHGAWFIKGDKFDDLVEQTFQLNESTAQLFLPS